MIFIQFIQSQTQTHTPTCKQGTGIPFTHTVTGVSFLSLTLYRWKGNSETHNTFPSNFTFNESSGNAFIFIVVQSKQQQQEQITRPCTLFKKPPTSTNIQYACWIITTSFTLLRAMSCFKEKHLSKIPYHKRGIFRGWGGGLWGLGLLFLKKLIIDAIQYIAFLIYSCIHSNSHYSLVISEAQTHLKWGTVTFWCVKSFQHTYCVFVFRHGRTVQMMWIYWS